MNIITSPNDKREYKVISLPNQLEVVHVIDPDAKISGASLTVNIGSFENNHDFLGLAHFLEHMLFMGTKKYPDESLFMNYVSDHGGNTNAFTAHNMTTYFFQIQSDKFIKGLDIFGHFFVDPLFKKEGINREVNAVNSEHNKNINNDAWRDDRILRVMANGDHPFKNFSTGNLETLNKDGLRDAMIQFYKKFYSANLMKLAVIHHKDISSQIKELFSQVPNTNVEEPFYKNLPFLKSDFNRMVRYVPINDVNSLTLSYQLPFNFNKLFKYKVDSLVSILLSHQAETMMFDQLKKAGLIFFLNGENYESFNNTTIYQVSFGLTDLGMSKIEDVLATYYSFLKLIKTADKKDMEALFNEYKTISMQHFEWAEKIDPIDYASELSIGMTFLPIKYAIFGDYYYKEYKHELITKFVDILQKNKPIITVSSKKFKGTVDQKEHFYGINYSMSDNLIKPGKSLFKFKLPDPNRFIPDNVKLIKFDKVTKYPEEIQKNVWYKGRQFSNPKCEVGLYLKCPSVAHDIDVDMAKKCWLNLLQNKLNSILYYAGMAGNSFAISSDDQTFIIYIISYPSIIYKFAQEVSKHLLFDNYTNEELDLVKTHIKESLRNYKFTPAVEQIGSMMKQKMFVKRYTPQDMLAKIDSVSLDDINGIVKLIKNGCSVRSLIQGNITKKEGLQVVDLFDIFKGKIKQTTIPNTFVRELSRGETQLYTRFNYNENESDNVIVVMYEFGYINFKEKGWVDKYLKMKLLDIVLSQPFFDELRTKKQTGYITKAFVDKFGYYKKQLFGMVFLVQSGNTSLEKLEEKIESFIKSSYKKLSKEQNGEFENNKLTLKKALEINTKNLREDTRTNMSHLLKGDYIFDFKEQLLNRVEHITAPELIEFYKKYFIDPYQRRIRIFHLKGHKS